jgi:outer membrane protein assembly factor BamB
VFITPAVAGGHVYVGSCSGRFIAFAEATGDEVWSYDTSADGPPAQFHGDALVAADLVIVGTDGPPTGWLYAFERAGGRLRWKHPFIRGISAQVLGRDGVVFAVGGGGGVVALDTATGNVVWHFGEEPPADRSWARHDPVLAGDLLLVPWPDGAVVALDARSGTPRWRAPLGAQVTTSVSAVGDGVWVGALDGRLRKLDLRSGDTLATVATDGTPYGDLQAAAGCLLVLTTGKDHALSCHEPAGGALRWRFAVAPEVTTFRPLVRGAEVVIGDETGALVALSLDDGEERWRCTVRGVPRGLSAAGERLFVGMLSGTVWALPAAACRGAS